LILDFQLSLADTDGTSGQRDGDCAFAIIVFY
jgi:hypothetical protein